jgi:hypothetical protein
MSQDQAREKAFADDERGMSIQQWEAFRLRAVALEMAVRLAATWESASLEEVLEVAEEFEAFLRGEEQGNGTEP